MYHRKPNVLTLDNPGKRYVLTIHDLPAADRPREKLQKHGPQMLSTGELMAVVLNIGTTKEDVLSMSSRIMREYGEKSIMSATNPKKLSEDLDIPIVRASQIVACAELGRRFYKRNDASAPTIRTANDVFEYVKDMRDLPKEHLRGIYLNAHYKVIHDEIISIGTVDTNIIHPREVFRPALEYAAAAVRYCRYHPAHRGREAHWHRLGRPCHHYQECIREYLGRVLQIITMYTIAKDRKAYIVSDSSGKPMYFLSHDEPTSEEKGQNLLSQYLNEARVIFRSECDILLRTDRNFTDADGERLIIMLKLLVDARKTWQEEENSARATAHVQA